jgi:hypothetical protein
MRKNSNVEIICFINNSTMNTQCVFVAVFQIDAVCGALLVSGSPPSVTLEGAKAKKGGSTSTANVMGRKKIQISRICDERNRQVSTQPTLFHITSLLKHSLLILIIDVTI